MERIMSETAIRVEGLGKMFRMGANRARYQTFRDTVAGLFKRSAAASSPKEESFWALKGLSFEIKRGEVVGVIGRNGAGKSTLLKILSRITEPTEGSAEIHGRLGSLLEVGTGFHSELSGRENIYLNGAILGMRRGEIEAKFDEIVAFAEVDRFLDSPVKHYSSGMYLRLAFAVAAHLEPEILLVDEVLAVGDAEFQRKCLGKMGEVAQRGRTVLLVSHNLAAVSSLCQQTLLLKAGRLVSYGPTDKVIEEYVADTTTPLAVELTERRDRQGSGLARIQRFAVLDGKGNPTDIVPAGGTVFFALDYASADGEALSNPVFEVRLLDHFGRLLFTLSSYLTGDAFGEMPAQGKIYCKVPEFPLTSGDYQTELVLHARSGLCDLIARATCLTVVHGDFYGSGKVSKAGVHGPFLVSQAWSAKLDL
jgi:lipopolysaccharide transport system ATP-binding protein